MQNILLYILTVVGMQTGFAQNSNTVNAILGDESFIQAYHQKPDDNAYELLRLQAHLSYVEALLRNKDMSELSVVQKEKRAAVLQLLHQYWVAGIFPKNAVYPYRRPCFIDSDGNICAVGYLIEQTAGRQLAEAINQKHQYSYLLEMNEPLVIQWAEAHGLSLEECAMIQPTYGPMPAPQIYQAPVKASYGVSSGITTGLNAGINAILLSNRFASTSNTLSYVGLVSGTTQVVLGLANLRKDEIEFFVNGPSRTITYKNQNNFSYLNIAAGTATVLTSAVNLFVNRRIKDKRNVLNLYSYPYMNNKMAAGIMFTRNL